MPTPEGEGDHAQRRREAAGRAQNFLSRVQGQTGANNFDGPPVGYQASALAFWDGVRG
jgi:hypothetical protein